MPNLTKTSQLSNDLMTFKSCGQGFRLGSKKVPIMEKPRRLCGLLHPPFPPPPPSTLQRRRNDCDGSWALLLSPGTWWSNPIEKENKVCEVSLSHGCTGPDLMDVMVAITPSSLIVLPSVVSLVVPIGRMKVFYIK